MSGTEALYYAEPGLDRASARLLEISEDGLELVLDRSLFYPEGGGQPCDLGFLSRADGSGRRALAWSGLRGPLHVHRLEVAADFRPGEELVLDLDRARRRDHAEQHSAQHLLSSVLLRLYGAPTLSFHLGEERCTIDVGISELSPVALAEAEEHAEGIIAEAYPIRLHRCPPEDPSAFPLRKAPPSGEEELRIVEIDGIDYSPCCGTHLASTLEIRALKLLGAERYKGMVRVSFVAGRRAALDHARAHEAASGAAAVLGCRRDEVEGKAARALERMTRAEASLRGLVAERARLEAELASLSGRSGPVVELREDRDAREAQEGARAYARRGLPALVCSVPELTACAAVPDGAPAPAAALAPLAAALGGRGGGSGGAWRASFPDEAALREFARRAESALTVVNI